MNDDWTSASFRAALQAMVRRRVPSADADDVVQAALTEAVASGNRPADPEGARKWIWGVARNKISDYHRRARRERTGVEAPEPASPASQDAERDLLRWAVGELPPGADAEKTFEWLLREGDGEKLEDIAEAERLPAPQVRQRVSRLRRLFRSRWAQLAAAGIVVFLVYLAARVRARPDDPMAHRPPRNRLQMTETPEVLAARSRARALREEALRACEGSAWQRCLDGLDEARRLDASGEDDPRVRAARTRARDALVPPVVVRPAPTAPAPTAPAPTAPAPTAPRARPPVAVPRATADPSSFDLSTTGRSLGGSAMPRARTSAMPRAMPSGGSGR